MVVVVANQKGGVGKTTTAVTLAHMAHLQGDDVAVVDLDAPGPNRPVGNLQARADARAVGVTAFTLADAPAEAPEFVFADCPADIGNADFHKFIGVADAIIIPTSITKKDLEIALQSATYVREKFGRPTTLLFTRIPTASLDRANRMRSELRKMGVDVLDSIVRLYTVYDMADKMGETVASMNTVESRRAAKDYLAVLHELKSRYRARKGVKA